MTDKWVQKLTQLAGEYQQESANGKADKGKFIQKAIQMANEMTDDIVSNEETKEKRKEMIGMAESFAGKIYGFDSNDKNQEKEGEIKPSKKKPGKGKPSYLIPKKETKENTTATSNDNSSADNNSSSSTDNKEETPTKPEHESTKNTTESKKKTKKRPTGGKPSYLVPKTENNDDDKTESNIATKDGQTPAQEKEETKETKQEALARKKAQLEASIQKEEKEIARLEKLAKAKAAKAKIQKQEAEIAELEMIAKKRAQARAKLEAEAKHKMAAATTAATTADLSQELASLPASGNPAPSAPPESEDNNYYSVLVPQGVQPGTVFKVDIGGTIFDVTCPSNVTAGQQMRIELPKEEQPKIEQQQQQQQQQRRRSISPKTTNNNNNNNNNNKNGLHYVIVPQGISPGMTFRVDVGGTRFTVKCPPNAREGQKVAVKVPSKTRGRSKSPKQPQQNSSTTSSSPSSSSSSSPQQEHYVFIPPKIHPGMPFEAQVDGGRFRVVCPPNTRPGMRIRVIPPAGLRRQPSRSLTPTRSSPFFTTRKEFYDVTVPHGVVPGQTFKINAKGQNYFVTCPPNVAPGQKVRVPIMVRVYDELTHNYNNNYSNSNYDNGYPRRQASLSPVRLHSNLQPYV
eukprot:CAMPEP_0116130828 /NCGR_PEP_ID=MMETSP0329-20121206/8683_1 /TAXON_ID=697910 /ORGANISM="Pseudo-nitzschia arenysensis, Strain B593" /LENGTH=626 /DNA_ID=CAMNT_0003625223 /DNA_START=81 /DNA_END=1961 /DNA_ORIENTATION=-